jgi:hypothetical protein
MYVCHVFLAFSNHLLSAPSFFQTHKRVWVDAMNLIQVLKALAINKKYLEYNNVISFLIKAIPTSHVEP